MEKVVLFGTGEIGELAHYYFTHDADCPFEVAAFTCDAAYRENDTFLGLPLVDFETVQEQYPPSEYKMHVALSYAKLNLNRKTKYLEAKAKSYDLVSYVCSSSVTWPDLAIGDNCFILENQTVQPTVRIGNNVMIWSGNHLGHACTIRDHAYISSHCCISGHAVIGERCFLGVNCTIKDFTTLGTAVFVAMGAAVTRDIPDDGVVLGASSTVLDGHSGSGRKLRSRYFGL